MCVIEAGSEGVPVISTRVGALPKLFEKQIAFVSSDGRGKPNVMELRNHIHEINPKNGLRLKKMVNRLCNRDAIFSEYRKIIRMWIGRRYPDEESKVTLVMRRYDGLGDVIMASALVNKAHELFPEMSLKFETKEEYIPIVSLSFPFMEVAREGLEGEHVIDISYNNCWEKRKHCVEGMGSSPYEVTLAIPDHDFTPSSTKRVGFMMYQNASAKHRTKEWDKWEELAENLKELDYECIQLGHSSEEPCSYLVDGRSETVEDLVVSVEKMDYIVTVENAAVPICSALNKPVLVLLGGSSHEWLSGFPNQECVVSRTGKQCFASIQNTLYGEEGCCGADERVSRGSCTECMTGISVDEVLEGFVRLLERA